MGTPEEMFQQIDDHLVKMQPHLFPFAQNRHFSPPAEATESVQNETRKATDGKMRNCY